MEGELRLPVVIRQREKVTLLPMAENNQHSNQVKSNTTTNSCVDLTTQPGRLAKQHAIFLDPWFIWLENHHRHIHIHNVSKSTILKRIGWVIGFTCNPREPCSTAEWSLFHYENTTYPDKPSSLESKTSLFLFNHSRFPLTGHNYLPLKYIIAESIV